MQDRQIVHRLLKLARTLIAEADLFEDETMSKLFVNLHTWITKFVAKKPASLVAIQMMENLKTVEFRLKNKMHLTGEEAVKEFSKVVKRLFSLHASPMSRLVHKYGKSFTEIWDRV